MANLQESGLGPVTPFAALWAALAAHGVPAEDESVRAAFFSGFEGMAGACLLMPKECLLGSACLGLQAGVLMLQKAVITHALIWNACSFPTSEPAGPNC